MKNKELVKMLILLNLVVIPAGQVVHAENAIVDVKPVEHHLLKTQGDMQTSNGVLQDMPEDGESSSKTQEGQVDADDQQGGLGVEEDYDVQDVSEVEEEQDEIQDIEVEEPDDMQEGQDGEAKESDHIQVNQDTQDGVHSDMQEDQDVEIEEEYEEHEENDNQEENDIQEEKVNDGQEVMDDGQEVMDDAQEEEMINVQEGDALKAGETGNLQEGGENEAEASRDQHEQVQMEKEEVGSTLEQEEGRILKTDTEEEQAILICDEQGNVVEKSIHDKQQPYDVEDVMKAVTKDGLYTVRVQEKDDAGQVIERRYIVTINKAGTSFRYDESKVNTHVSKFAPEISLSNLDEVTILSCMMNGRPAVYQMKDGQLQIDENQLHPGKNRITLDVKDRSGNISSMIPWEFSIEEEVETVDTSSIGKKQGFWSKTWKSIFQNITK